MRSAEKFFTWFLLVFFVLLFAETWQYAARARLVPLILLVPGIALTVIYLWMLYRRPHLLQEKPVEAEGEDSLEIDAPFSEEMAMVGWFILFIALIWLAGFLVATPLFLIVYLRLWARERWPLTLAVAGLSTGAIYLLVEVAFRVILYRGWLFSS